MRSIAGRKISWPEAKDHRHTYIYMWLSKFYNWTQKEELDDLTICQVIYALVRYAKRNNILYKGSAILQHERIYAIALSELENYSDLLDNVEYQLKICENAINDRCGNLTKVEFLLKKPGIGQYPNIISLYNAGIISKLYLSVSKSCRRAIKKLDSELRMLLPDNMELFKLSKRVEFNKDKSDAAKSVLNDDYLK